MEERTRTVIGFVDIPAFRKHGGDGFCKEQVEKLVPGKAIEIHYAQRADLDRDRRNMINAATRKFGSRKMLTATDGLILQIWLTDGIATNLKDTDGNHVAGTFIPTPRW